MGNTLMKPEVTSISVANDLIASGSEDRSVRITDMNGNLVREFPKHHESKVEFVSLSSNGKYLISCGGYGDYSPKVIKLETNEEIVLESLDYGKGGHTANVWCVSISMNGDLAVSCSRDNNIIIWKLDWNNKSYQIMKEYKRNEDVNAVELSSNGKFLLTGSDSDILRLINLETDEEEIFEGHKGNVNAIDLSENGNIIVSGGDDKDIFVWEKNNEEWNKTVLEGHTDIVTAVKISDNNKYIVSGSEDNNVIIWENGKEKQRIPTNGDINSVAIYNNYVLYNDRNNVSQVKLDV